jgi:hypothetical protein
MNQQERTIKRLEFKKGKVKNMTHLMVHLSVFFTSNLIAFFIVVCKELECKYVNVVIVKVLLK